MSVARPLLGSSFLWFTENIGEPAASFGQAVLAIAGVKALEAQFIGTPRTRSS